MSQARYPDSAVQGRRWLPFVLLTPFQFIFGLIYSWGAIAPAIHRQSGWSEPTLDLCFSLTPLALMPAVVFAGHALHRTPPKTLLAIALSLFTLGGLLGIAPGSALPFMAGYSILALGLGAGLSTAACIAMVSRLYPGQRGSLGGALLALYGMSSTLSAPVFQVLDHRLGWQAALAALVCVYAALGWLAWFGLPATTSSTHTPKTPRPSLRRMIGHPPLLTALAIVMAAAPLGSASFATIGQLSPKLGFNTGFAVIAVSLMAFGNGLGRFGFGVLADLRSARFSRNAVLTLNLTAAGLLLLALEGIAPHLFVIYPLLIGLTFGGMAGKLPSLAAAVARNGHTEAAFGLLFGTFALASFLGPLITASLGVHTGLTVLTACALLAVALAVITR